jgi:hypothetical protein
VRDKLRAESIVGWVVIAVHDCTMVRLRMQPSQAVRTCTSSCQHWKNQRGLDHLEVACALLIHVVPCVP